MLKKYIFHPILFALYTVLSLFSVNMDRVSFNDINRAIFIVLISSTGLFLLLRAIMRSWGRAGLTSTLFILLFSTYGHVYRLLAGVQFFGFPVGQANYIAALWAAMSIILTWMIIRILKDPRRLNEILNIISIACLVFPVVYIGINTGKTQLSYEEPSVPDEYTGAAKGTSRPPDIYYIILDEYGRADVLNEIMSYDNSALVEQLRLRGFYVADLSQANYIITLMSIASSLNSQYLDNIVPPDSTEATKIIDLINNNNTMAFLKQQGYLTVTFATGYHFSEIKNSDYRFYPDKYINDFELAYLENSILSVGINTIYGPRYRSLFLHNFERLKEIPSLEPEKPKFVFAHIMAAHAPFVFGPNGESISPWNFHPNANQPGIEKRSYTEVYTDQITYANKRIIEIIDVILAQYDEKPIIIIQSDHGPESLLDWYSVENSCIKERISIFNAYFFPDQNYETLYPTITPVNTFRVTLNKFIGTKLNLFEDKSFFSTWDKPYRFIDITNQSGNCSVEASNKSR